MFTTYDMDPPDFQILKETTVLRARREHKCDLCKGVIEKGCSYKYIVMKYEGEFMVMKNHLNCYHYGEP